jgi:O-succinylbenzoic acid--CoA ligase
MSAFCHPLVAASRARPEAVAVRFGGETLTYQELQVAAARGAGTLAAMGVGPGKRVALVGAPSLEWVKAFHAVGWLGAIAQPVSHKLPKVALEELLELFAPDQVLVGAELALEPGNPHPERLWPGSETRIELASSGTGGQPRRVSLDGRQLFYSAVASALRLGHSPADAWLDCLPLHHVGGLSILFRCAWYGTCVALHDGFEVATVQRELQSGSVTQVSLVPTQLERLLEEGLQAHENLRFLLVGGAPPSEKLLEDCAERGLPVAISWGMTETASQVATRRPGDLAPLVAGCPPLSFVEVEVDRGALVVKGPMAPGGRLRTSDSGWIRGDRVGVTGRLDDLILSGGENVDPLSIEQVLGDHPGVRNVLVVGRDDARWGQRPVAWLVAAGETQPEASDLAAWCRERLPSFAIPDAFRWCASLPRTELGKPSRARVRDLEARFSESGHE